MSKESRYEKIARECYDRVLTSARGRYDIEDVKDEVREEIVAQGFEADAVDLVVEQLVRAEDDRRARPRHAGQLDLFTGDETAYDVVWKLLGGQRVQVRYATRVDHDRRVALKKENLDAVQASYDREKRDYERLFPYYVDDTTTVPQAVAAWIDDNAAADQS